MVISISTIGSSGWYIQLVKYGIKLEAGKKYRVRFKARAENGRSITAYVGEGTEPWGAHSNYNVFSLTNIMEEYSYTFDMTTNDNDARIKFDLGTSTADVYFESIVIESIELQDPTTVIATKEYKSEIYPNPVTNRLTINNFDHFEQLIITNINGSKILNRRLSDQSNFIDVGYLASGIYFVSLLNQKNRLTTKIIKK